jgi:hypothetical protein
MDLEVQQTLMDELMPGESILWAGKPNASVIFCKIDIFLVPFTVLWLGFIVYWIIGAAGASVTFSLFGLPFLLIGLFMVFGRFIIKTNRKRKTGYAVTNKRVIIILMNPNGIRRNMISADIKNIQNDSLSSNRHNNGSLIFGNLPYPAYFFNSGLDFMLGFSHSNIVAFFDVDNIDQVYSVYRKAKYDIQASSV